MPTISDHAMARKKLVNMAGSYLLDAMIKFTQENDELTAAEWIRAVNDAIVNRVIAQELADQWGKDGR